MSEVLRRTTGTVAAAAAAVEETGGRNVEVCPTEVTAATTAGDAAVWDVMVTGMGRMSRPHGGAVDTAGADISNLVPGAPIVAGLATELKLTAGCEASASAPCGTIMRLG